MWQIWLIIAGLFVIGEIITTGFLVFWLSLGSLVAMIVSIFAPDAVIIQTAVFVISSTLLILFTKPLVDKYITQKTVPTNVSTLIGKKAKVIVEINLLEGTGQIKVGGEIWSATTDTEEIIQKGTEVEILQVNGVKLLVRPCKIESQIL